MMYQQSIPLLTLLPLCISLHLLDFLPSSSSSFIISSCFSSSHIQNKIKSSHRSKRRRSNISSSISNNTENIPKARVVAAHSLIEKQSKKHLQFQNSNNNPVTKLESNPNFSKLSPRDKSFARNIVSTTTRRKGQIDKVLSILCNKKYPAKCGQYSDIVNSCLRMGVGQILFMEVKDFAAVKETVNVLKDESYATPDRFVKFVNAILRRVVNEGREILENETSGRDNVIQWLFDDWIHSYGEDVTMKMIDQFMDVNSHQHVTLSLNINNLFQSNRNDCDTQPIVQEQIQSIINKFEASASGDHDDDDNQYGSIILLPNKSLRIKKGKENIVSNFPLYNQGSWWVQDVSSTLPAIGLISAMNHRYHDGFSNVHIVDMCSAPGGKTAQLLAAGFGKVTAIEANSRRCRRLQENLNRLGLQDRCEVVVSAGQDWVKEDGTDVAAVLLDVPCSATGTGMRRPDVLQKGTKDLDSLLEIQEILANHCVDKILSSGGILVYATCSLLKMESEDQVTKLIQRGDVEILPFTPGEIPGFDEAIDSNGWLRVLPGVLGGELNCCDGFFVARLMKI